MVIFFSAIHECVLVLFQVIRYNRLLKVIHSSLNDLKKALKGQVVMSQALETMFNSLYNNIVPDMWAAKVWEGEGRGKRWEGKEEGRERGGRGKRRERKEEGGRGGRGKRRGEEEGGERGGGKRREEKEVGGGKGGGKRRGKRREGKEERGGKGGGGGRGERGKEEGGERRREE